MKGKCQLFDEENNVILNKEIDENYLFIPSLPVIKDLKPYNDSELFDNLNDKISILIPYKNDYIMQYANFNYNDFDGVTKDIDLFNKSYLKTFPIMDILGFKKILDEVYVTGKTRNLKILYYVEDSLIASSRQKIFKYNNKIYCIFKTKSNSKTKFMDENDVRLLYNAPDPLMIIQNKKIVAANKANEKITGYKPK